MTLVSHDAAYTADRGYGFDGSPGLRDEDATWIRDSVSRDGVRLDGSQRFVVDVPPGTYAVKLSLMPAGDGPAVVEARPSDGSVLQLKTTRDAPSTTATVEAPSGRIEFAATGHASIRSLVLVRQEN